MDNPVFINGLNPLKELAWIVVKFLVGLAGLVVLVIAIMARAI